MSLLTLQRDFHRHLIDAPNWLGARIGGDAPGLAVYYNNYHAQLTECLTESFPHTLAWVGGAAFLAAMREHIDDVPPQSWTLGNYGAAFADTLARCYPDDPEVAELARLEWLLSRAFEAPDNSAVPVDAIAAVDWDDAALIFVASVQAVPAATNAGAIWSALAAGDVPPGAAMLPDPAMMLVWRDGFTPCFRTIEMIEHGAIVLVAAGVRFADLCTMLVAARGEAAGLALAGQMLGRWFADGLINTVTSKGKPCA